MSSSSTHMSSSSWGWTSRGRRVGRGMPKVCICGETSVIRTSGTATNPGRLFHCCPNGSENVLTRTDKNHLFRWIDKIMVEEIDDLKAQVGELVGRMGALEKSMEVCESEVGSLELETRTCEAVVNCYDEKINSVKGVHLTYEKEIEAMKKEVQECKEEIRSLKNIIVCGFVIVSFGLYYYVLA